MGPEHGLADRKGPVWPQNRVTEPRATTALGVSKNRLSIHRSNTFLEVLALLGPPLQEVILYINPTHRESAGLPAGRKWEGRNIFDFVQIPKDVSTGLLRNILRHRGARGRAGSIGLESPGTTAGDWGFQFEINRKQATCTTPATRAVIFPTRPRTFAFRKEIEELQSAASNGRYGS